MALAKAHVHPIAEAFFGLLAAGAVPAPLHPPLRLGRQEDYASRTAALLQAVDDVIADNCISEVTRARFQQHFTNQQMLDVVMLHGMYQTLGCLINTWGVELDEHVQERLPEVFTKTAFRE